MYEINYLDWVIKDIEKLDKSIQIKVFKKLIQISENPIIGKDLWNKNWLNLVGYKKVYIDNKKIRIIYKIIDEKIEILVIAIWKREIWKYIILLLEDIKIFKNLFFRIYYNIIL